MCVCVCVCVYIYIYIGHGPFSHAVNPVTNQRMDLSPSSDAIREREDYAGGSLGTARFLTLEVQTEALYNT